MNSRERLLLALDGRAPDRVPISTYEIVGFDSRAVENNDPSYARLMQAIREETDCLCMWDPKSNATFLESAHPVEMELTQVRRGDTVIRRRILHTRGGPLTQTTKEIDGLHTVWQTEHWCKTPADVDAALSVPYEPLEYDVSDFARIRSEVGEHGLVMTSLADPLWLTADLMDFGRYTVWARTETEHFARTLAILHERAMENLRRLLAVNGADVYRICGPEYATPPYLPPAFFERFVVPQVSEMTARIHGQGARVRFHCHGRIRRVLEMIERTGPDALDPCEAPPDGDIDLAEVKRRVGGRLCLFGNLQPRVLEHGTPEAIVATVRACMDAAKAGGGYVIMPTAAPLMSPLPAGIEANYLRFIEAARRYGAY
jgi:hypothetical protein